MTKKKKPEGWTYKVGDLTAFERTDRGGEIWTRVWDAEFGKYRDRQFLSEPIRAPGKKKVDPELETRARLLAEKREKTIASGIAANVVGTVTLDRGRALILDEKEGKYAGKDEWPKEVKRYWDIIVRILRGSTDMEQLKHAHYRKLWRTLAHENVATGKHGIRAAEMIVGALQSGVRWLQMEEWLEGGAVPAPNWVNQLREDWTKITGNEIVPPARPRHDKDEHAKLWEALPKADPRLRIAIEIGAELRLGQVPRSRRSDVRPHGGHVVGKVRVHGRGKKLGEDVVLSDDPRVVLSSAIADGVLSDLEAAYQKGDLPDYLLVTGGFMAKGKVQIKNALKPPGKKTMNTWFHKLEALAGVKHAAGRAWYGLRRRGADDTEDATSDGRVQRKMGGWKNDETRRRYQDEGRTDIAEKTAEIRARIRPKSKVAE